MQPAAAASRGGQFQDAEARGAEAASMERRHLGRWSHAAGFWRRPAKRCMRRGGGGGARARLSPRLTLASCRLCLPPRPGAAAHL